MQKVSKLKQSSTYTKYTIKRAGSYKIMPYESQTRFQFTL